MESCCGHFLPGKIPQPTSASRSARFKLGFIIQPGPGSIHLIAFGLYLVEGDYLSVAAAIWQFPLIALGMAVLLICAVSPRLPFRRVAIPGAAFIASIAYSAYLIQKLVIHFVAQFCTTHNLALTSVPALVLVEICVYAAAIILFLAVERPFLQLRHRFAPRASVRTDAGTCAALPIKR